MDLNILRPKYFLIFKNESISSIQFNGKIINMMLPSKFVSIFTPRYLILSVGYSLLPHNYLYNLEILKYPPFHSKSFSNSFQLFYLESELMSSVRSNVIYKIQGLVNKNLRLKKTFCRTIMIINKINTNNTILFLKNINLLLLYKTPVSLFTPNIFISSAGLACDWLQTNEKKKLASKLF